MNLKSVIGSHDGPMQLLITDDINGPVQIKTLEKKPITLLMMGVRLQNIIDKDFEQLDNTRMDLYSLLKRSNDEYQIKYIRKEINLIESITKSYISIYFEIIKQEETIVPSEKLNLPINSEVIINQYQEIDNPFIE
ncbi:MAG: hypothetical protein WC307_03655 [Candidatus Nanoarchaeia archaeon]|jgi:hypothetical protein